MNRQCEDRNAQPGPWGGRPAGAIAAVTWR